MAKESSAWDSTTRALLGAGVFRAFERTVRAFVPVLGGIVCAAAEHLPPEQSAAVTVTVTEFEVNTRTLPELELSASVSAMFVSRGAQCHDLLDTSAAA